MRTPAIILTALLALSILAVAPYARADNAPAATGAATAQVTAKVVGVDYDNRVITLQDANGNTQSYQVSPDVKRFNQIKVGDTITFSYQESVALNIVKAGAQPAAAAPSSTPIVTSLAGDKPAGQVSRTMTTTVTIQAIDASKPSVTVKTEDGRVLTFAVQNRDLLKNFKVGDNVQVTYSQAVMVQVK
jgi:Cu/Ag efflux protein CusF